MIAGCNSGVFNRILADGATFNDRIGECVAHSANHGGYVKCVTSWLDLWKQQGLLSKAQRGKILDCAAMAAIP